MFFVDDETFRKQQKRNVFYDKLDIQWMCGWINVNIKISFLFLAKKVNNKREDFSFWWIQASLDWFTEVTQLNHKQFISRQILFWHRASMIIHCVYMNVSIFIFIYSHKKEVIRDSDHELNSTVYEKIKIKIENDIKWPNLAIDNLQWTLLLRVGSEMAKRSKLSCNNN